MCQYFESHFKIFVGAAHNIEHVSEQLGQKCVHGISACRTAFSTQGAEKHTYTPENATLSS
jgi:hypothetical protein